MPTASISVDPPNLTRRQLAEFLTERGFPISKSTLDKLAMPACGEGPPHEGFWGNRALYNPDKALIWAKERFRTNWRETGAKLVPGAAMRSRHR